MAHLLKTTLDSGDARVERPQPIVDTSHPGRDIGYLVFKMSYPDFESIRSHFTLPCQAAVHGIGQKALVFTSIVGEPRT